MDKIKEALKTYSTYLVLLSTVFSYLSAFAFESGQCMAYGIPSNIISINLSNLLYSGFLFQGIIVAILSAGILVTVFFPSLFAKKLVLLLLGFIGMSTCTTLLAMMLFPNLSLLRILTYYGLGLVILVFSLIITSIIINSIKKKSVKNIDDAIVYRMILGISIMITLYFPVSAYCIGNLSTRDNTQFYYIPNKSIVILKKYEDLYIGRRYNVKTKHLNKGLVFFKPSDGEEIDFVKITLAKPVSKY